MELTSLKDLYLAELQELANAEAQPAEPLARVAEVASHPALKKALNHHSEETLVQKKRVEGILRKHKAELRAHRSPHFPRRVSRLATMFQGPRMTWRAGANPPEFALVRLFRFEVHE